MATSNIFLDVCYPESWVDVKGSRYVEKSCDPMPTDESPKSRKLWGAQSLRTSNVHHILKILHSPLINKQLDPENHQFLMETSLPTPMTARVYVNLPEGISYQFISYPHVVVENQQPFFVVPQRFCIRLSSSTRPCHGSTWVNIRPPSCVNPIESIYL